MTQEYYGDSSNYYSQYLTDDKKYEYRIGPFEGFFVSSVEFCKHIKFDNDDSRKDHNIDTKTGPPGPTGPQGQPGSGNNNSTLINTFNCIYCFYLSIVVVVVVGLWLSTMKLP
jgi:hypothetical protein